ncbi:hypothetical protein C8F01DRAFT_980969 [Mycena amicta]|nr:hypothetical protein C8F01DRAFT_980969 [Mycena amicta]
MSSKPKVTTTKGRKPEKIHVYFTSGALRAIWTNQRQHPDSRVATQRLRRGIRNERMADLRSKAKSKASTRLEFYAFMYGRVPPDSESSTLSLPEMHVILQAWVSRHEPDISAEQAARRKGRPKSVREMRLEEARLREHENYRTGIEVPDLTDADTLARFRKWDFKSLGYAHLLRFVRISSLQPDVAVLSRPPTATGHEAAEMDDDEAPQLIIMDGQMDET